VNLANRRPKEYASCESRTGACGQLRNKILGNHSHENQINHSIRPAPIGVANLDPRRTRPLLTKHGKVKSFSRLFGLDALVEEAIKEQQQKMNARDKRIVELKANVNRLESLPRSELTGSAK